MAYGRCNHGEPKTPEPEAISAATSGGAPQAVAMAARSSGEAGPRADSSMSPSISQRRAWTRASERSLEAVERSFGAHGLGSHGGVVWGLDFGQSSAASGLNTRVSGHLGAPADAPGQTLMRGFRRQIGSRIGYDNRQRWLMEHRRRVGRGQWWW